MSKLDFYISAFPTQVVSQNDRMMVTYSDGNVVDKGLIPGYADKELVNPYIDDRGYLKWFYPDETEHGGYLVRVDTDVEIVTSQVTNYGLFSGSSRTDLNDTYRTFKQAKLLLEDTYLPICLQRYWPDITTGNEVYRDGNGNRLTTSHPINSASYSMISLTDFTTNARHYFPNNNDYAYYQWEFADAQVICGVVASLWYSEEMPWEFEISNDGINWYFVKESVVKFDDNRFSDPTVIENTLASGMENSGYYVPFDKPVTAKYLRMIAPQEGRTNRWRGAQIFVPITNLRNVSFFLNYDEIYFDFNSFEVIESTDEVFVKENLEEKESNAKNVESSESLFVGKVTQDNVVNYAEPVVFDTVSNTVQGLSNRFGGLILDPDIYEARISGLPKLNLDNNNIALKGDDQYSKHYGVALGVVDESTGLVISEIKFLPASTGCIGHESIKTINGSDDELTWKSLFKSSNVGNEYFLGNTEMIMELDYHKTLTSFQFLSGYAYYQNIADIDIYTSDNGINWNHLTKCNYRSVGRRALTDKELVNVRTKWIKIVPNNTAESRFGLTKIFIGTDDVDTSTCETLLKFEITKRTTVTFRNFNKTSYNWNDVKLELYRTDFTNKAAAYQDTVNGNEEILIKVNDSESSQKLNDGSEIKFIVNTYNSIVNTPTEDITLTGTNRFRYFYNSWNWDYPVSNIRNIQTDKIYVTDQLEPTEVITEFTNEVEFSKFFERFGNSGQETISRSLLTWDHDDAPRTNLKFKVPNRIEIYKFDEATQEWVYIKSIGSGTNLHHRSGDADTLSDIKLSIDGEQRTGDGKLRTFDLGEKHVAKKVKYVCHGDPASGGRLSIDVMGVGELMENPPVTFKSPNAFQLWKMSKISTEMNAPLIIRKIKSDGSKVDMSDKEIYVSKHEVEEFIQVTETIPPGQYEITTEGHLDDYGWYIKGV